MCLILLAWHAHPEYPLIFAGNRDEAYDRPSAAAEFWKNDPDIFGGCDLEKGGTWLGLSRSSSSRGRRWCSQQGLRRASQAESSQPTQSWSGQRSPAIACCSTMGELSFE